MHQNLFDRTYLRCPTLRVKLADQASLHEETVFPLSQYKDCKLVLPQSQSLR